MNYDGPEAAPATESGSGPPLPQWTTDTSSAMACARFVARRRLRRGVPRASRVRNSAAPSTGPGMQPAKLPVISTVVPTWTPSAVAPGREAAGARPSAARRIFASAAANVRRSRAGRPVEQLRFLPSATPRETPEDRPAPRTIGGPRRPRTQKLRVEASEADPCLTSQGGRSSKPHD